MIDATPYAILEIDFFQPFSDLIVARVEQETEGPHQRCRSDKIGVIVQHRTGCGAASTEYATNHPIELLVIGGVLGLVLGAVLLAQVALFVIFGFNSATILPQPPADFATPTQVATLLFTRYALPFEVTSVILLVAVVGVIVLTRGDVVAIRSRLFAKKKEE